MADLFSKISEILSNPESAQKIREIAAGLSGNGTTASASDSVDSSDPVFPETPALPTAGTVDPVSLFSGFSGGAHSRDLTLLNAVRPYLRSSRAGKIDNAIKAIRIIDLLSALR